MLLAREMTSPGQEVQHTIAIFVELNFKRPILNLSFRFRVFETRIVHHCSSLQVDGRRWSECRRR